MRCASRGSCGCAPTSRRKKRTPSSESRKFTGGRMDTSSNIATLGEVCNHATRKGPAHEQIRKEARSPAHCDHCCGRLVGLACRRACKMEADQRLGGVGHRP